MKFTVKTKIKAPAKDIYTAWLNTKKHTEMTGGEASCNDKIGKSFTAWDEYISGKNLVLVKDEYIKQSWRTVEFADDQEDSILEIYLKEIKPNLTEIKLIHSNLLPQDIKYKQGWIDNYFEPMKMYFEH